MKRRIPNKLEEFITEKKKTNFIPFDENYEIYGKGDMTIKDYVIDRLGKKEWGEILKANPIEIYDGIFDLKIVLKNKPSNIKTNEFDDGTYQVEFKK